MSFILKAVCTEPIKRRLHVIKVLILLVRLSTDNYEEKKH